MTKQRLLTGVAALLLLSLAGSLAAQERDAGETPEALKLKGRTATPAAGDIDPAVNLQALLAKNEKAAFSESKAATVEGWVVQVEREEDGDYHVALAPSARESDSRRWVIVEVPPAWQKKSPSLSGESIRKLKGKKVRATGWLYFEPDSDQTDPRGTRWELHPVTELVPAT